MENSSNYKLWEQFSINKSSLDDQTDRIQNLLDEISTQGGGVALLPAGQFHIRGTLIIPSGVRFQGEWHDPHHGDLTKGTTLFVYSGKGDEAQSPFIQLSPSSSINGFSILYPEQELQNLHPYPWTIQGRGMHNTVENITLVNSYNGIAMGPESNELHIIRNIFGCVLRRGIFIDRTTDIGRIENVHFNPHYWTRSGHSSITGSKTQIGDLSIGAIMQLQLEAFIFGRTDWEYVHNTFVFGAKIGYKFIRTENGMCNGQFHGIGADACDICVKVEEAQPAGILISNGEFVCLPLQKKEVNATALFTSPKFTSSLQLSNCSFWGKFHRILDAKGDGYVSISQATMTGWNAPYIPIVISRGRGVFRDILFSQWGPHFEIEDSVERVVVKDNFARGGVLIINKAGKKAIIKDNEDQMVESSYEE